MSNYREFTPSELLSPYVERFWCGSSEARPGKSDTRVLPDGCIDFVFRHARGRSVEATVVGTMTCPQVVQTDVPVEFTGVRFRPGGAIPFLGACPASALTDITAPLDQFWSNAPTLVEQLSDSDRAKDRLQILEYALLYRLADAPQVDHCVEKAVGKVHTGVDRVADLAKSTQVSRQHLTRLFLKHIGIGPKAFIRIIRMQSLRTLIKESPRTRWAELALSAGYYDQSHMISDCNELAGATPSELATR